MQVSVQLYLLGCLCVWVKVYVKNILAYKTTKIIFTFYFDLRVIDLLLLTYHNILM